MECDFYYMVCNKAQKDCVNCDYFEDYCKAHPGWTETNGPYERDPDLEVKE